MPEYSEKDLIQMQNDAMKRVMEMQRRARESYSSAQIPGQNPGGQVYSPQGSSVQETFSQQPEPCAQSPVQSPDLVRQLFLLLGSGDPILSAALAYLL